jgi:hypothetical protein
MHAVKSGNDLRLCHWNVNFAITKQAPAVNLIGVGSTRTICATDFGLTAMVLCQEPWNVAILATEGPPSLPVVQSMLFSLRWSDRCARLSYKCRSRNAGSHGLITHRKDPRAMAVVGCTEVSYATGIGKQNGIARRCTSEWDGIPNASGRTSSRQDQSKPAPYHALAFPTTVVSNQIPCARAIGTCLSDYTCACRRITTRPCVAELGLVTEPVDCGVMRHVALTV